MSIECCVSFVRTGALALCAAALASSAGAQVAPLDLATLTASDAAQRLCAGSLTSEQLVTAYLAQAKAKPQLNAFITLDEAGALTAARAADAARRSGGRCKPLGGLPVAIKDNIQVQGLPASAGTPALKGFVASADAPVVAKLRAAGAVVLGKTNMHELAFGVTGYNPTFQTGPDVGVRNAYDATRIAGGSSSGNGAALGARMAPAALGTDTGGSVRIPCAFNGCAALRPTVGRYSQQGIVPISHTRDTAGPMALSVADLALLDRVIAGGTPVVPADLKRVRLGVAKAFYANLDEDTRAATDAALAKLREAGVTLVDVEMPRLAELNGAVSFPVVLYEIRDDLAGYLAKYRAGVDIGQVAAGIASPDVKGTFEGLVMPRKLPAAQGVVDAKPVYDNAIRKARPALQKLYSETFRRHRLDALVFPTVPRVALAATPESSSVENFVLLIQNTDPGSNAGIPGLQLPSGLGAASGLPVGLELDGPAGSDRRLLAVGLAVEGVLGRLPPPR
ncbi:Mandelamide hydrolase [Variovorax sp. PBL-H6]|uniref:indoleacetamide hydrolase n=1 Tax=Variovorax sp. PBL-H6 TaxID=434009 RepID=UPI001319027C|nr:indoleacetamide hydrolase [Variovorax sp. PBL-H6]VTU37280.1 Mandelamide hydrolase [Variovorax sp. PBL-H6]